MNKKRVYLSSPQKDLLAHRETVKSALECAQYDVECMEKYPAFAQRPIEKCLEDVANCDYYVLILAWRYGHVPSKDNPRGLSFTHLEYEQAIGSGKPCLPFLLDPHCQWPPEWVDSNAFDPSSKIGAFREHLADEHGRKFFSDANDLASAVLQALRNQDEREPKQGVRNETTTKSASSTDFRWPTRWDFTNYIQDKRKDFIGRTWLFDKINAWLNEGLAQAMLIYADFGFGKSAMIAEFIERNPEGIIAAYHFCQHDSVETLYPGVFVCNLVAHLGHTIPGYREAVEADPDAQDKLTRAIQAPATAFDAVILNPLLRVLAPDKPKLLIVDALDEGLELDAETACKVGTIVSLLASKASRLPAWLSLLVTSRNNPQVGTPLRQAFRTKDIDAETVQNKNDLRAYTLERCCREPLAGRLQQNGVTGEAVANLLCGPVQDPNVDEPDLGKSRGKFLYVVRVLNDLTKEDGIPIEDIVTLPPGMDGFYLSMPSSAASIEQGGITRPCGRCSACSPSRWNRFRQERLRRYSVATRAR
jgi:hypothetical protein